MHTGYPQALNVTTATKTIRKNQKSVTCEVCFGKQHIKCTELNVKCTVFTWTCPKCLLPVLSFFNCPYLDTLEELNDSALDTTSLQISETQKEHPKDLRIMHLTPSEWYLPSMSFKSSSLSFRWILLQ